MMGKKEIKFTYDAEADAVYIPLSQIGEGEIVETIPLDDLPANIKGDINLDFDKNGKLRGIEILYASEVLTRETLDRAKIIG